MVKCNLIAQDNNTVRCTQCDRTYNFPDVTLQVNCYGPPPTRARKIASFLSALWQFVHQDGGEFLAKEKIEARFEICKSCPHFTGRKCMICGCGTVGRNNLFNKLAYPSQQCPDNRWGPENVVQGS
jgi:hypothetical protein